MKKVFTIVLAVILVLLLFIGIAAGLTGCNKQIIDTTFSYERCIVSLPNGEVIEAEIDSWKDYDDGDQIQVKINGKQYLVHSSNIVLISK